jgi:Ca-activated chloride channel family protein
VRRSRDPGLLEYLGNDLFQLKVFPVPAKHNVSVSLSSTAELTRDAGVVEYVYPLKTDGKATSTLEKFAITATLKSQHGVQSIYSPTHAIGVQRSSNREAKVAFQQHQALLDKDFRLLFTLGEKDVGLTALTHRPAGAAKGHVMLLLSPRAEPPKGPPPPRDVVLVLDVSGSMAGASIQQAKAALKFVLDRLGAKDRFGLIAFADHADKFGPGLWDASPPNVTLAKQWVDSLQAVGGTNINAALLTALDLRSDDPHRNLMIIFFTDGQPTTGETVPEKIVANVVARNTANTRLFTFGVGHDVNATLVDQLALRSRAASVYVRPSEDIESKVSALYQKISQPVLVNLRLSVGSGVIVDEMYPPQAARLVPRRPGDGPGPLSRPRQGQADAAGHAQRGGEDLRV